jgi:hypothetical protein
MVPVVMFMVMVVAIMVPCCPGYAISTRGIEQINSGPGLAGRGRLRKVQLYIRETAEGLVFL